MSEENKQPQPEPVSGASDGSLAGHSPHFGRWEIRVDEHGAIVVQLRERIRRYSPEAFFETVLRQSYLELKWPGNGELNDGSGGRA